MQGMKLVHIRIKIGERTLYESVEAYLAKTTVFSEEYRTDRLPELLDEDSKAEIEVKAYEDSPF